MASSPMALALSTFRRLPVSLRRRIVRIIAPTYVVGVVAVITNGAGDLLLLRERHHEGWALPGGLVGRREPPVDALVRELREEIGVSLSVDSIAEPAVNVDAHSRRVDVIYRVASLDQPVRACPPEVLEVQWFSLDLLPDLFEPTLAALRAADVIAAGADD